MQHASKYFRGSRDRGFTLVELLVVIAIIGVLVGLLLPAVQQAREASRRTQCQNNLRQIGVGLLNYEQQHEAFPIGFIGYWTMSPSGEPLKQQLISWNVQLLPFIEQRDLWQHFRFDLASFESPNRELGATLIPTFLCPSTVQELLFSPATLWRGMAFTDYGGMYGVEGPGRDREDPDLPNTNQQPLNDESLGVMLYDEPVRLTQITDGTMHTVVVAELLARRINSTEWANGHNTFAQFQNLRVNDPEGKEEIGSPHPGGAFAAFCDGHVAFLHDETEQAVLNALLTRSGGEAL
jgi:prepilin-type N-terminal cleavage/methylation domain-containing protein/prepilin-type processing-associated H-X9-DG protein